MSANLHLTRRNGTYYYRRRVPDFAVDAIGRSIIQYSLKTTDKREAKKLREFADLEWTARFERAREGGSHSENPDQADRRIDVAALVRDYVERRDQAARKRLEQDPPISREEVEELKVDAEMDLSSLGDPADPNRGQWISSAVSKILSEAKLPEATVDADKIDISYSAASWSWRAADGPDWTMIIPAVPSTISSIAKFRAVSLSGSSRSNIFVW